jgi:hypothetical protein
MKLPNLVGKPCNLATVLVLGWVLIPQFAPAAIPSGEWQVEISDPTNRVWDVTHIAPLQSPVVEFFDDDTVVSFDAPFTQNGSGKLAGAGATDIEVTSSIVNGTLPGEYVAKGTITGAKGMARLTFSSSVKGNAMIEGRLRAIASSFAVKVALDSLTESPVGTYTSTASAAGYGSLNESGNVDISWQDVVAAMGDGSWTLHLSLTNDAVKKVGGTAVVDLSGGRTLGFTVKGNYNAKTDGTILVLTADAESKGSSLKVALTGNGAAALQGKLTGQTIKAIGTLEPD